MPCACVAFNHAIDTLANVKIAIIVIAHTIRITIMRNVHNIIEVLIAETTKQMCCCTT